MIKGKLIGQGRTAEIYDWKEGKVLKLFRKGIPDGTVEHEYKIMSIIQKNLFPVPKAFEMIDIDGRKGIVYEKVSGQSMLKRMALRPWTISAVGRKMAELHTEMHGLKGAGLPSYKESLKRNIQNTDMLSDDKKRLLIDMLDRLQDGDAICHGDFHPDNVIMTAKAAVIIDWMTAACGSPMADLARTTLLIRNGAVPEDKPYLERLLIEFVRSSFYKGYIKRYLELSNSSIEEMEKWIAPVAAARLVEGLPKGEKDSLLKIIDEEILKKKNSC